MKHLISYIFVLLLTGISLSLTARQDPPFLKYLDDPWVDSLMLRLSVDQKIGQLFMIQAYARDAKAEPRVLQQIQAHEVGGVLFMQGTASNQRTIIRQMQQLSHLPLLIALDAEWGPAFRLEDTPRYPVAMALGAIADDTLIYRMGLEIGEQLKKLGVHINFAPVADVNNNPNNPVINYRSFGEDPEKVTRKSWLYASGLQDAGILAVAKHFPGHGDTRTDSHTDLPVIRKSVRALEQTELFPFRQLIQNGIGGIMTAHLQIPALEPDRTLPSSLSGRIVGDLLQEQYGFRGLVVTDAMNMQGVNGAFSSGESAVRALLAGNDMLEVVPELEEAVQAVRKAITTGRISMSQIDRKCRKILALKRWSIFPWKEKMLLPVTEKASGPEENARYALTRRILHEQSLTLLHNRGELLPLQRLDTLRPAVIAVGDSRETDFQKMSARYLEADFFHLRENAPAAEVNRLVRLLKPYNLLICGIHGLSLSSAGHYGTDASISGFIRQTADKKRIITLFGNPYALNYIEGIDRAEALLITYEENRLTQELAAQAIFGAINLNGRLPVNVSTRFRLNEGMALKKNFRLKYTIPEETGIDSRFLEQRIDSLARLGLARKAYPGCQVLIAREGKVILLKTYGYHTYEQQTPVTEKDLYDLASLTKILGVAPALMKLHGEGIFRLDVPFATYWPDFRGTDKAGITPRQMLAHQSRLPAGIVFWNEARTENGQLDPQVFQDRPSEKFSLRVSSRLYMNRDYREKMFRQIRDSRLRRYARYTYSDLPFMLFPRVIGQLSGEDYEQFLQKHFFRPLGASSLVFNPHRYFPSSRLIPTENDDLFRHELIRGYVHDEGAAMLGGVSGNAGLFGQANDVAKLMQLYLQQGFYGGQQYLKPGSVSEFTRVQFPENDNRRGLAFDKPLINNYLYRPENAYPAPDAGADSYGHSGFTGTFTWADPGNGILFVFLANRIHPTRNNPLLSDLNIRSSMLQTIYDSIRKGWPNH
ncbi:MAG: glycoside hydrolase family 3 N-terminal domain-containing protein [Mangrovibacterium sp.]